MLVAVSAVAFLHGCSAAPKANPPKQPQELRGETLAYVNDLLEQTRKANAEALAAQQALQAERERSRAQTSASPSAARESPPAAPPSLPPVAASSSAPPPPSPPSTTPPSSLASAASRSQTTNAERLQRIATERASIQPSKSYRIGPGDLVEINVFDLPEMTKKLKVNSQGFLQLPLIGTVKAAGLSQEELASDIAAKLEANFLQDPQVDVVVEGYESQQVAVTGAVMRPGLYPLTKQRYTILDMISQAGGLGSNAGAIIQFIPASEGARSTAYAAANAGALPPLGTFGAAAGDDVTNDAVSIDLNDLLRGGNRTAFNLTVTPGDVIFVPEAGTFTIEGWVDKPGTYPLNRTTTVLAALSIGGGGLFPTRLGAVQVLRSNEGSAAGRDVKVVDLNDIRDGKTPDIELRSGDIVHVPANPLLVPLWGVYTLIKNLITIGGSVPLF